MDNFVLKDTEGLFCVWDQPLMSHVHISYCGAGGVKKAIIAVIILRVVRIMVGIMLICLNILL